MAAARRCRFTWAGTSLRRCCGRSPGTSGLRWTSFSRFVDRAAQPAAAAARLRRRLSGQPLGGSGEVLRDHLTTHGCQLPCLWAPMESTGSGCCRRTSRDLVPRGSQGPLQPASSRCSMFATSSAAVLHPPCRSREGGKRLTEPRDLCNGVRLPFYLAIRYLAW
jgi:hypothetical protein